MPELRYQKEGIANPGPNDVMFGRGGGTNNHEGNKRFRKLVNDHKLRYLAASKVDKPKVARDVVNIWRNQAVPGRFLTKTGKSNNDRACWHDVGDQRGREKASQCLRERTPDVMPFVKMQQQQQQQQQQHCNTNSNSNSSHGQPQSHGSQPQSQHHSHHSHLHSHLHHQHSQYGGSSHQEQSLFPEKIKSSKHNNNHNHNHLMSNNNNGSTRSRVTKNLHDLNEITQQQHRNKHERRKPPTTSTTLQQPEQPSCEFDAASIAVALLEEQHSGREDPVIKDYLRKLALMSRQDDDSIDENASATAIARAIFKNVKNEDGDDMSLDDLLCRNEDTGGYQGLDDALDTLSKFSWSDGQESLARIRENNTEGTITTVPDGVVSSRYKLNKMNSKRSYKSSNKSTISDLTDILDDGGRDSMSFTSTVLTREKKMAQAKDKQTSMSNVSMFSSLTDVTGITGMTGSFSNLEI